MCTGVLPVCMHGHHVPARCLWRPQEGIICPLNWSHRWLYGTLWVLGIRSRHLQEHLVLLTSEPSPTTNTHTHTHTVRTEHLISVWMIPAGTGG